MATRVKSQGRLTLPDLANRLKAVRGPAFRAELSQVLAAAAGKLVADGFRGSFDPYGKAWAPVQRLDKKLKRGFSGPRARGKPLMKTGRLRASFAAEPVPGGRGFRIDATADYAIYHQHGTRRMARRQMVPAQETGGLPPRWSAVFDRETARLITRVGGGQ